MFSRDKTHTQLLFLFNNEGLASMNPIHPMTEPEQLLTGVRQAVQEHGLYGVITVVEAWVYMPQQERDHILIQLRHNEMQVADLRDEHKTEALIIVLQSKDGEHVTWLHPIITTDGDTKLGTGMVLPKEKCLKQDSFFTNGDRE